jgi:hypothetical protein
MLAWPLRPPTVAWLGGMALASVLVQLSVLLSPLLAVVLAVAWWMLAFKLASEALETVAAGHEGDAHYAGYAGDGVAFRQLVLGVVLLVAGALCWRFGGMGARVAFGALVALLLPAVIVVLVLEDSVLSAFDPRNWLLLLRGVGADYVVVAGQAAALAIAVGFALALSSSLLPALLAAGLAHGLVFYWLLATYRALGVLIDRHRDALAGPDEAPAAPAPELATPEERVALREAQDRIAAGEPAAAAAVLDRLIRGRGATAPVHARYRALLATLGDEAGLQAHAHAYIATLLHLGKRRDALALYLDARGRDPGFELADPQALSDLIAAAAGQQHSQLAVALAEEFARRFPRDRDLVLNGLTAARLMDRLGREAEAAALLRRLLAAQPEHPLAPELELALRAIRPQAS